MADILIKGIMEMPKTCAWRERKDGCFHNCFLYCYCHAHSVYTYKENDERPSNCPLVALPEHGRLCDLDALIEHETYNIEQALFDSDEVLEDLKNAPVIVEATE